MKLVILRDRKTMKNPTGYLSERIRTLCSSMLALASVAIVLPSQAQILTLTDAGSIAQINTGSQAGMYNWSVGGMNQLQQQWFWYRIGTAGPEQSINTISAPTITQTTPNQANVLYGNSVFSVDVSYVLTGNTASSGLNESIRIINKTASNLDLHFFQYLDFNLLGQTTNQSVVLNASAARATQTFLSGRASEVATPNANHREAALFGLTLSSLNDVNPTTLNDNLMAGPGDVTFAFQWDFTIAAGGSQLISKIVTVPEPSAIVLMALGLVAFTLRRAGAKDHSAPVARSR